MPGDLHCHSKLSDGSLGLEELILLVRKRGLDTVAITDHDTTAGVRRAGVIGARHGVRVIEGVELSCYDYDRHRKAHLLAYRCESPDRLEEVCVETRANRSAANRQMAAMVMKLYPMPSSVMSKWMSGSTCVYKQHIMHALMEVGYTTSIYGELYDELFGEEGKVLVKKEYPDVHVVLKKIHEAGGVAVLAHPMLYDSLELMEDLIHEGLDGIEVWHPNQSEEDSRLLQIVAQKRSLLVTGGSDFHGMYGNKATPLGTCVTPDEDIERLLKHK